MKNKMTDEAIRTVINNAPDGAEYWTSGYDVGYRKLVLDCVFGWIPDDAKWAKAIDNDIAMERVDKGFWIPNLVKELVERQGKSIPQTKEVEWVNGLPPVGVECEMIFDGKGKLITPLFFTEFVDGLVLFYHSSNSKTHCDDTYDWCLVENCIFRKPETPEDREKREREENGQSLYELVQNLWCSIDRKYTAHPYDSPMVDSKTKEMYSMLAVAVEHRKGGE